MCTNLLKDFFRSFPFVLLVWLNYLDRKCSVRPTWTRVLALLYDFEGGPGTASSLSAGSTRL